MAYKHQNFVDDKTILKAEHLINIEDAIIDLSPSSYKYSLDERFNAFMNEMNVKARLLGAKNCNFVDPTGINNTATAYDMARIMLNASDYEKFYDIWNTPTRDLNLIQSDGSIRTLPISSTVVNHEKSPALTDFYNVMGGKTGSLSTYNTYNMVSLCQSNKNPDDWYVVAMLRANSKDSGNEHRYQATKEIMDIVESMYDNNDSNSNDGLDDIAWENLSYRDIFIKSNKTSNICQGKIGAYTLNSGTPEIVSDTSSYVNYVPPYSLKCFGTPSQQLESETMFDDYPYFAGANVKIDRYEQGYLGISFDGNYTATQSAITNGWEQIAEFIEDKDGKGNKTASNIYIGSIKSANLDGYINTPVLVPMSIFKTKPSLEEMKVLYSNFVSKLIEMGGTTNIKDFTTDVCCSHACVIKKPHHNARAFRYLNINPIYEKDADVIVRPASTTKILTSLVCMDYVPNLKDKVLITQEAIDKLPSNYYGKDLFANEIITFEDLIYAMMLPSSNVACYIIACSVGERILRSKNL